MAGGALILGATAVRMLLDARKTAGDTVVA